MSGRPRRRRHRVETNHHVARGFLVVVVVSLLIAAALVAGMRAERLGNDSPPPVGNLPSHPVALGAFLGADAGAIDRIAGFSSWLGSPVTVARQYLPGNSWEDLKGADWAIDPWTAWRAARPERMLVLNVPMVAPNFPAASRAESARLLREGASGQHDDVFRTLAQRLVARKAADTVIVLGWEMNGGTYTGRCVPDPTAWKQYWRRIVTAMRSVPGQRFRFDWAPVRGTQSISWVECYPGDDVVDIIGMDSYDQHPGREFTDFVTQPDGLGQHADFAKAHGKPISFPEWGLYSYGDDPAYMCAMRGWISTHNVAYQTITDYCPHGVFRCTTNPRSSNAYRQAFGPAGGCSQPTP